MINEHTMLYILNIFFFCFTFSLTFIVDNDPYYFDEYGNIAHICLSCHCVIHLFQSRSSVVAKEIGFVYSYVLYVL